MPVFGRRPLCALIVFCSAACTSLPARANSVPVSGTAYGGNDSNGLTVTAGNVSIFSASPIGYSEIGAGEAGVPISLHFWVLPWSGAGYAYVTVGNKVTDIVNGAGILFTGTFTVPFSAIAKGTFDAPISVAFGQLSAWQDLTFGQYNYTTGPLMANLLFNGTGVATFAVTDIGYGQFLIPSATFTFSGKGNLSIVPEPGSLFLVGTGLVVFGTILRRKYSFRPPA